MTWCGETSELVRVVETIIKEAQESIALDAADKATGYLLDSEPLRALIRDEVRRAVDREVRRRIVIRVEDPE